MNTETIENHQTESQLETFEYDNSDEKQLIDLDRLGWAYSSFTTNLIEEVASEKQIQESEYTIKDTANSMNSAMYYEYNELSSVKIIELLPSYDRLDQMHMYNFSPKVKLNLSEQGFLDDNVKSKVFYFNLKHIKSEITFNYVYALITAGTPEVVIALISRTGHIYFARPSLQYFWNATKSMEKTKKIISDCFDFVRKEKEKYLGDDVDGIKRDLLISSLSKLIRLNTIINETDVDYLVSKINKSIESVFSLEENDPIYSKDSKSFFSSIHHAVLKNKNSVYRKALFKLLDARERISKVSFFNGINITLKLLSQIAEFGYVHDRANNVWVKEVNIKPTMCFKGSKLWRILPKYRSYEITKLIIEPRNFITSDYTFRMHAEGKHPNVSPSSVVCLGIELDREWRRILTKNDIENYSLTEDVSNFLNSIEKTLEVPNFDSAFFDMPDFSQRTVEIKTNYKQKEKSNTGENERWIVLE